MATTKIRRNGSNNNWHPVSEQEKEDLKIRIDNEKMETNGKFYRFTPVNTLSEEMIKHILSYVGKINSLVNPKWKGRIEKLWIEILGHEQLAPLFFPKPQSKKCKEFEKNNVLRIVGILRNNDVYHNHYNDTKIHHYLEDSNEDSNYRSVIGSGLKNRELLNIIRCLINGCKY